jgi:hypothetical protein
LVTDISPFSGSKATHLYFAVQRTYTSPFGASFSAQFRGQTVAVPDQQRRRANVTCTTSDDAADATAAATDTTDATAADDAAVDDVAAGIGDDAAGDDAAGDARNGTHATARGSGGIEDIVGVGVVVSSVVVIEVANVDGNDGGVIDGVGVDVVE